MEVGENLGQERIIESHTVGPEGQGIQTTVEALSPVERIGVAPGVSAGLAPQHHNCSNFIHSLNLHFFELLEKLAGAFTSLFNVQQKSVITASQRP